jgi:hypothetical protein
MTQAVHCLQTDIEEALAKPKGKLHAIFINYAKMFDNINRTILLEKLKKFTGPRHCLLPPIRNLLLNNWIERSDGIARWNVLAQTISVLQGNPLSPLLFIIATADITEAVVSENVKLLMYADDMVLTFTSQTTASRIRSCNKVSKKELRLNEKTVSMTFRRGGRCETFYIGTKQLKSVTNFKYLGVTFQTPGNVFTLHLNERLNDALKALNDIKHLNKLSLTTAIKLFQLKVNPVETIQIYLQSYTDVNYMTFMMRVTWGLLSPKICP